MTQSVFGNHDNRILLMLLPFWTPLIPPLGIACLKSFLQKHGYEVTTADANQQADIWKRYYLYNNALMKCVPEKMRGNFLNTGHNVLRHHCMAFMNKKERDDHLELIKIVVERHYFCDISDEQAAGLDEIVAGFFQSVEEYTLALIEKNSPSIVGLSVYSGNLAASLFAFETVKKFDPTIATVMGGGIFADQLAIGTPDFQSFLDRTPYIDTVIVGEGESLFLKYLQGKLPPGRKVYSLEDNADEYLSLAAAVSPDFSDFNVPGYPQMATYVSRSCPFQCTFCSETVQWGKFRKKDAGQVADELVRLYEQYKSQIFMFGDSLLNPFVDDFSEEMIRRDLSFYWDGYLRADRHVCNLNNTLKWRRGGFYRARLGVESGSQRVLDLMDKRITTAQIRSSLSNLAGAGIKTSTYWVIGFPGETEEDFRQTLELIEEMKDDIWEAECNPFWYYPSAQVGSDRWFNENGVSLLFPERFADRFMVRTWVVNADPVREVTYDRVRRFMEHCAKLGVPNPYTLHQIYLADQRWQRLHENAVPMISQFNTKALLTENKKVRYSAGAA
ncbi:MAG TPA: radical SAM protein [Geobacteraceae bacterium]